MTDQYFHPDVLDNGLDEVEQNATQFHLLKSYTLNQNYATVVSNSIATVAISSTNMTIADGAANQRVLTLASPLAMGNATDDSGATPDLAWAFLDASRVLAVTDAPDQEVFNGNPITMTTDTLLDSSFNPAG